LNLIYIFPTPIFGQAQDGSLGKSLTTKLGIYVFPAQNQSSDQQSKDVNDCYQWAVQQSGVDPINPPNVEAQQVQTGPDGSMVRGGAKGAAVGAAIGAIAGDAGKGAAIGAVSGVVLGVRRHRVGQAAAQQNANVQAQVTQEELMNNFKKAYTVCLEGKGYTVK
jgi:hypothetical protein